MRHHARWAVVALGFAACGRDDGTQVTVNFHGRAAFVDVRVDDGGDWRRLDQLSSMTSTLSTVQFSAREDYELVWGCDPFDVSDSDQDVYSIVEVAATVDTSDFTMVACELDYPVAPPPPPPPGTLVHVSGTMVQPGKVQLEGFATSPSGPWDFGLDVDPGTWDLVATSDDSVAIRRAQDVTATLVEPTIDLATEGAAFAPCDVTLAGGLPETASAGVHLNLVLANGEVQLFNTDVGATGTATLGCAPDALLQPGDSQYASANAAFSNLTFAASTVVTPDSHTLTFLDAPTGLAFTASSARVDWTTIPVTDNPLATLTIAVSRADTYGNLAVLATHDWLQSHDATSLALATDAPDIDPSLLPTADDELEADLVLSASTDETFTRLTIHDQL